MLHRTWTESLDLQREMGGSEERLEELERSRARWEAEVEAMILKAESTYKSAANAESRGRTMERHAQKLSDPFAEEGDEVQEGIPPEYAPVGESQGVLPLRVDVAEPSKRELAKRMKFLS